MVGDESLEGLGIAGLIEANALERHREMTEERARRNATPYQFPGFRQTGAEHYGLCIPPRAALTALGLSSNTLAITQLLRELRSGRVQAVCHEAISFIENEQVTTLHAVIGTWLWHLERPSDESDFWETGYFRVLIPKNLGKTEWQGEVEFFGVRFWPDGLPGGADNPLPGSSSPTPNTALPALPAAEAERVATAIIQVWGTAINEVRAVELARGMCPGHRVSRDPFLEIFRAIRGPKNPGKQASNGN